MSGKTVLVTGASGFIGRQTLQPLIELGYQVHAVSRKPLDFPQAQWHSCDLFIPSEMENLLVTIRPSHLLHAAWYTVHGKFWTAPENEMWLEVSAHLLEKFITQGGERILGIGSCAEYDWQRKDRTLWKETDPCRPHTAYGQAKHALQEKLAGLAKKSSVSFSWARIFSLFGPHENPERLVPYSIRTALAGETVHCTEGTQVRDYIDTRVCGRALARLLDCAATGTVNVASGNAMPIADLVRLICTLCGHPDNVKFGTVPMNKDDSPFMAPDLSRLRDEVGFSERQDTRGALTELIEHRRVRQGK